MGWGVESLDQTDQTVYEGLFKQGSTAAKNQTASGK